MGTMVQYRDLPGGPIMIKFADEISRHCLCQNCRMFSMSMYSDPASHLFCDTCISEQSYKHNKFEIYCPDERKPVPFEQLFEALDVVTILRDQHVQCPNQPKCAMILPLEQLENHYIQCKELTSVNCTKCRREVAATSWNKHKSECQPTCDSLCSPKESQDRNNLQFSAVSPRGTPASTPKKTGAAKGARPESTNIYPTNELQQIAQGGTTRREERATSLPPYPSDKLDNSRSCDPHTVPCTFCGRQVKNDNMQRHVQACYARPTACPSCDQVIKATDMNAHITRCQRELEERIKKRQQQQNTTSEKKKSETASKGRGRNLPSPSSNAHAASQGEASMGVDVQYRDLPGGTRRLRFADELPRRLMCGTCGMLSMHMLEDKQGHAFCNVCVGQKSQATAIFCEYEKKNVSLDELVESFDINQIIKDQVVFCPNEQRGCRAYTPLSDIEDHYLQCERTEIECAQCQQRIRGCHWKTHLKNCPRKIVQCRYCVTAFPQIDLQTHEALCTENPNRITSTTAHLSSLSNSSAFPVSAEMGARSEYASPDMTFPTRDPVKIRHQGWPWWFLPVVICFTCLTFFPRTIVNVFLKPLLDTAFRIMRLACTALLRLYKALLSAVGPRWHHSVTRDSYRAVQHRSFY